MVVRVVHKGEMKMKRQWNWQQLIGVGLLVILVVGILSACGSGSAATTAAEPAAAAVVEQAATGQLPELVVTKNGDELVVPDTVPAGPVMFVNQTGGSADINRLNDGVTPEQLQQQVDEDVEAAIEMITMYGGPMVPGGDVVYDLEPGSYAVAATDDEGNVTGLAFLEAGEPSGATPPTADLNVDLVDFAFVMPTEIKSGPQTWQITNKGTQWHEMAIIKLADGSTIDDVMAMIFSEEESSGPPPFEMVGGWTPMGAGQTVYTTMDLPPGEYTVLCFLPDLNSDFSPHLTHGMVATLTVTQ